MREIPPSMPSYSYMYSNTHLGVYHMCICARDCVLPLASSGSSYPWNSTSYRPLLRNAECHARLRGRRRPGCAVQYSLSIMCSDEQFCYAKGSLFAPTREGKVREVGTTK